MGVMTASGVATPRGVAKPRTKNMKVQFNDWAFFIGSKSPRTESAITHRRTCLGMKPVDPSMTGEYLRADIHFGRLHL